MLTDSIKSKVLNFCEFRYPGFDSVLIYGSHVTGGVHENSDIDLLVIFSTPCLTCREIVCWEGDKFDVFVYDAECLNGAITMARMSHDYLLIRSMCTAISLPGLTQISKYLIEAAQTLNSAHPLPHGVDADRIFLSGLLEDFSGCSNLDEKIFLSVELFKCLSDLVLGLNGYGGYSKRHGARIMQDINNELKVSMCAAFAYAVTGKTEFLEEVARHVLDSIGGEPRSDIRIKVAEAVRIPLRLY